MAIAQQTPVLFPPSPTELRKLTPAEVREQFLIEKLFVPGEIRVQFTALDRLATGGAMPTSGPLELPVLKETGSDFFLARRELGALNIGGPGRIEIDGESFSVGARDCVYAGRGSKSVKFFSDDAANPAKFALFSAPAHKEYPNAIVREADNPVVRLGEVKTANVRTIRKCIFAAGIQSCQLVMGYTTLEEGSVWNTFPPHTHNRRSEIYLYFDQPGRVVAHFVGEPQHTRHVFVGDEQAVLSPPWSVHCGVGTGAYRFIWAMAGENIIYDDMDPAPVLELR
jgi:4-deoxy-L-threo-5-hexosulose-uronate ketol-isomerase